MNIVHRVGMSLHGTDTIWKGYDVICAAAHKELLTHAADVMTGQLAVITFHVEI